jgi:diguanylate cyclase (GGDEF)-like protein
MNTRKDSGDLLPVEQLDDSPECNGRKDRDEILILEDDPEIGRFYEMKLTSPSRAIFIAQTMKEAARILEERDITLILLDLTLPDADGRSFLHRVRQNPRTTTVPIIVVSARRGPVSMSECFDLGADEYFEKPVHPDVLAAAVGAKLKRDAELSRRTRHDVLTGVLNRIAFQDVFHRVQAISRRAMSPLAMAILDLDRFKSVNDQFGHPQGDQVLIRAAQIITRALRRSDVIGRWGGDEFVVLLPDTDSTGARRALETVARALKEDSCQIQGREVPVSFSAGIIDVGGGTSLDEAIAEADRLLYQIKADKARDSSGLRVASRENPKG